MFLVTRIDDQHLEVRVQGALDGEHLLGLIKAMFELTQDMRHVKVLFRLEALELPTPIAMLGELARKPHLITLFDRLDRCVFVAERPWRRLVERLHSLLLPNLELKSFPPQELSAAKKWLQGSPITLEGLVIPLQCATRPIL